VLDLDRSEDIEYAAASLRECQTQQLAICIAGPRESEAPGVYDAARSFLYAALERL
jgi:hypothetical protein